MQAERVDAGGLHVFRSRRHTVIGVIYTSPYAPGLQYRKLQALLAKRR